MFELGLLFQNILYQNIFYAGILAFGAGILACATPCVYPLVPIIAGVIGAHKQEKKLNGFFLSLAYVTGMSLVFTILGMAAVSAGKVLGAYASHPWVYFLMGNLCLFLAFWMFGLVNIPQFNLSNSKAFSKNQWLSVFLLGAISGFIASPCTSPILGLLLLYVATTGNFVYGGILLFLFGFGMGSLLILVGTFVGLLKSLPKPGGWMVRIKFILAIIMVLVAEYFLIKTGGALV
ncbi:cytochrome c biogenesis protein CcdA [Candidatus Margulisiibacteriota bacterium]